MNKPEQVLSLREQQERNRNEAKQMISLELIFSSVGGTINKAFETLEQLKELYLGKEPYDQIAKEAKINLKEGERLREELQVSLGRYRSWIAESRQKREKMHYKQEGAAKDKADALETEFTPTEEREYRELLSRPPGSSVRFL